MTTIACDLNMMASDQRVTVAGGQGTSYKATKVVSIKTGKTRMLVGACGHGGDCSRFLDWAKREFKDPVPKWVCESDDDDSIFAMILKPDGVYLFTQTDPEPERSNETFYAIGSGGKAARVAMMLGKNPEEAVQLACQVDDNSGGPVEVFHLKDKEDKENK